ncbi:unnamed protein product [Rhizophagus irregularis]|nr:unnamed protein product [Rhizophagus irregularis]
MGFAFTHLVQASALCNMVVIKKVFAHKAGFPKPIPTAEPFKFELVHEYAFDIGLKRMQRKIYRCVLSLAYRRVIKTDVEIFMTRVQSCYSKMFCLSLLNCLADHPTAAAAIAKEKCCGLSFFDRDGISINPMPPLQILFLNMVSSSPPAMGLGIRRASSDTMNYPPCSKGGIFTWEPSL